MPATATLARSVSLAVDFEGHGLSIAVFCLILFAIVLGLAFLGTRTEGSLYDRIGEGGLTPESDFAGAREHTSARGEAESAAEREAEIRQMLGARNDRRVRDGLEPIDVDAEVARLLAPAAAPRAADHELREEVRQLVGARNERRVRDGLQPLDVEAEVTRTLAELGP